MLEQTTSEPSAAKRCIMGSATDAPCPYPVTDHVPRLSFGEPHLCAYHAATEPLREEENDLNLALELFKEWQKVADEHSNRPLHDLLLRAQQEFEQRQELISGVLDDLRAAEKRLVRP